MRAGETVARRFVIEQVVGAGMMGVVFRARDLDGGQTVAVKVLRANDVRVAARFQREAQVLAHLRADEIVSYVAHGTTEEGEAFIVMEWADGETLKQRLDRGPLSTLELVDIAARIATAIGKAHAAGVVHRDLKPSNVVLGTNPPATVKVVDFGVARFRSGGESLTGSGDMIGTPAYMSPEQARGAAELDGRSDIYSLGCILFRSITGRCTFEADDAFTALLKLATEQVPPIASLAPGLPAPLGRLVDSMLCADSSGRPRDASEVLAALAEIRREAVLALEETLAAVTGSPRTHVSVSPARTPMIPRFAAVDTLPAARDAISPDLRRAGMSPVVVLPPSRPRSRRFWIALAAGVVVAGPVGIVIGIKTRPSSRATRSSTPASPSSVPMSSSAVVPGPSVASAAPPPTPPGAKGPGEVFFYTERYGQFDVRFDCEPAVQYWPPTMQLGRTSEHQLATCSDKRGMTYVSTNDDLDHVSVACDFMLEQNKAQLLKIMKCDVKSESPVKMGPLSGVHMDVACYDRTMQGQMRILCDGRPGSHAQLRTITIAILRFTAQWEPREAPRFWDGLTFR